MYDQITASLFKQMVLHGAACITREKQAINDLNVFPVPDGDTGTNMSMTLAAAVTELQRKEPETVDQAASITASALLRGARGNSGVILSLLFRGISKGLKGHESAAPAAFAAALQEGVSSAYKAVMKPTEGTILTVSRLAAKRAVEAAAEGEGLEGVLAAAIAEGRIALEQTIDMNPVLKKAGVVDAGGKGFLLILEGLLSERRGEPMPELAESAAPAAKADFAALSADEITFAFDTVFIVRKTVSCSLEPFREFLNGIGDSLVIGEDDEAFKVHVHTNTPGEALTEAQKYGTLELAKIENMRTQHEDLLAGKKAQSTDDLEQIEKELEEQDNAVAAPEKEFGVVTVCAGAGMEALFRELGADGIVTGGQTMNPSTDDILKVINKTPASTVFVFPNNKNITMAAEQCIPLTEKKVIVMPTKTVPQGVSALLNFNPDEGEEQMVATMKEAISNVHTAMITYAARDSDFDGHNIHAGEYLALLDGALIGSYTNLKTLFKELSWAFDEFDPEFITVYYGEDVKEDEANDSAQTIIGCFPDADVSVVSGGQPVYYYMIAVE